MSGKHSWRRPRPVSSEPVKKEIKRKALGDFYIKASENLEIRWDKDKQKFIGKFVGSSDEL